MLEPVQFNQCLMLHFIMPPIQIHRSCLLPGVKLPRPVLTGEDIAKAVSLDRRINVSDLGFVQSSAGWGSGVVRELRRDPSGSGASLTRSHLADPADKRFRGDAPGLAQGYPQGYPQGYQQGYPSSYPPQPYQQNYPSQGYPQGYQQGYQQGYPPQPYQQGYQQPYPAQPYEQSYPSQPYEQGYPSQPYQQSYQQSYQQGYQQGYPPQPYQQNYPPQPYQSSYPPQPYASQPQDFPKQPQDFSPRPYSPQDYSSQPYSPQSAAPTAPSAPRNTGFAFGQTAFQQGPASGAGFANNPLFQDAKPKESGAAKRPFSFL